MTTLLLLTALYYPEAEPAPKKLTDAERAAAVKAGKAHLGKLKADPEMLVAIADDAVGRVLPGHAFFTVIYPQFPVARMPAEGLKSANVLAVDAGGKVVAITTAKELEKFLIASLPPAAGDAARKDAARAAVRLGQELHQDGFYKFKLEDDSTKVSGGKASARAVVMDGGNGTYAVTLSFDKAGKLTAFEEAAEIRRGTRPRCQATKLLDPDPVVRAMAEDGLLIMGKAAIPYMLEQREKASPPLRRAIEGMWRRIVSQGR